MKVSIITPAYNCKNTIKHVFDSVLGQTFTDWEWIIVDDCSTDGSFELIKQLADGDARIFAMRMPQNGGTSLARNVGLKHAKGRYITFLDSDDFLDRNYLECQLEFIKANGPLVSAGYRRKAKRTCTDFYVPSVVDYKMALKGNPLSCLTTMYDREAVGEVFFLEDIDKPEDYVFWLNVLKTGVIAKGNPHILATYNIVKGSKSFKKLPLIKRMHRIYHKSQNISWFKSWLYVVRWSIYGMRKYKNVR